MARAAYRSDIDGLRAIGVLSVVAYHLWPEVFSSGFIGVDIFFVISGFLITGNVRIDLDQRTFSLKEFYFKRARRIFPVLALLLFVVTILGIFLFLPPELSELGAHVAGGSFFVSNFVLFLEAGYFDSSALTKPLLHLWSLAVEEQFYLLWPLFLMGVRNRLLGTLGVLFLSLTLCLVLSYSDQDLAFYFPASRFWELLSGSALALMPARALTKNPTNAVSVVAVVLLGFGFVAASKTTYFPGWVAILPVAATALLITSEDSFFNRRILTAKPLVWVGVISYPLYLWHWPLISLSHFQGFETTALWRICVLGLSFLLAALSHVLIEAPCRRSPNLSKIAKASFGCLLLLGLYGLFTVYHPVVFHTYPPRIGEVLNHRFDRKARAEAYREDTCFLNVDQGPDEFHACGVLNAGSTVLWGDSNAAHLYPGLRTLFPENNLVQFTAARCAPLLPAPATSSKQCRDLNAFVHKKLKETKPAHVILAGFWRFTDWNSLRGTLDLLKAAGVGQVTVVGPSPEWDEGIQQLLFKYYRQNPSIKEFPESLSFGLVPGLAELDDKLKDLVLEAGARYVSPRALLCPSGGCQIQHEGRLLYYDNNHLTPEGSALLAPSLFLR